ncbi:hypothetical protein [Mesorhizobium sp. M0205]|uniref:hypothetical protein n=1 Tax=Mesorhizobium sp. M0205 TaxID=2956914 RepID=UPI003339427E
MSLADAHAFAFSLAATLMVAIVIFRAATALSRSCRRTSMTATTPPSSAKSTVRPRTGLTLPLAKQSFGISPVLFVAMLCAALRWWWKAQSPELFSETPP